MAAVQVITSPGQIDVGNKHQGSRSTTSWRNLAVGAGMNIFQVTTLGQPLENIKTYVRGRI